MIKSWSNHRLIPVCRVDSNKSCPTAKHSSSMAHPGTPQQLLQYQVALYCQSLPDQVSWCPSHPCQSGWSEALRTSKAFSLYRHRSEVSKQGGNLHLCSFQHLYIVIGIFKFSKPILSQWGFQSYKYIISPCLAVSPPNFIKLHHHAIPLQLHCSLYPRFPRYRVWAAPGPGGITRWPCAEKPICGRPRRGTATASRSAASWGRTSTQSGRRCRAPRWRCCCALGAKWLADGVGWGVL